MPQEPPIFVRELQRIEKLTRTELTHFFEERKKHAASLDSAHLSMVETIEEICLRGGKFVGPYMCWAGFMLANTKNIYKESEIIPICAAVELVHRYLLSLDDMADRDTVRHGGPTFEVKFGQTLFTTYPAGQREHYARTWTEISCAVISTYIYELIVSSSISAEKKTAIIHILNQVLLEDTAAGWQIHMLQNHEPIADASEARFREALRLVTAQYKFVGPLHLGAICADGSHSLLRSLEAFGNAVGLAFQIHDDELGLFGNEKEMGKAVGNDVREGKKTLLIQYAYQKCNDEDKAFLEKVVGSQLTEQELERVQQIVRQSGAYEQSQKEAAALVETALHSLDSLENGVVIKQLKDLAKFMITRGY